jgi:hypothetical protein
LKTSNPNTHVSPSNGSSTAKPLRPIFTFRKIATVALVVLEMPYDVEAGAMWLDDKAFRKAKMKITMLI